MIFIAGCARSGTTLMQRLMRGFDVTVVDGEHPIEALEMFNGYATEPRRVVKRNSRAWRKLHTLDPKRIGILYMVRHPHDVLTSYHPRTRVRGYHVTPERWLAEYGAWEEIAGRPNTLVVRYEDLLTSPAPVQDVVAGFFELESLYDFEVMERLDTTRIGRHKRDPDALAYLDGLPEHVKARIAQFCKEFGYG